MLNIAGNVDPRGHRAVERLVADAVCGSVEYRETAESTNTLALQDLQRRLVNANHCPKLYLADQQTSGRGRHGRSWISTDGALTFSLIVNRPQSERALKLLSVAVGVGVASSLEFEFSPLRASLKWPNDVHVDGGKLAGILIETSSLAPEHVVIGVGMNISDAPDLSGHPEGAECRDLSRVVGRHLHRYDVIDGLIRGIIDGLHQTDDETDNLIAQFRKRCLLTGRRISYQDGAVRREGICRGMSDDGELVVESEHGIRYLQSGEARLVRSRP